MSAPFDPAITRALDALEPPPLSAGFADRVVAATASNAPAPRRRDRRGPWMRGRQAALGAMALALMSATAAAAGLFGDVGVTVPALERFVERVAQAEPAPPAPPVAKPRQSAAAAPVTAEGATEPDEAALPAPPPAARDVQREIAARRIAAGIERRIERRERLGLPVDPRLKDPAARLDAETAARYPGRAALVERVQEIRQQRRDGTLEPLAVAPELVERRRWRDLSPAERAAVRARLRELRRQRLEAREGFAEPPR